MMRNTHMSLAIDVGTSSVNCLLAVLQPNGKLIFTGVGQGDTRGGMQGGVVVDIDIVSRAVVQAVSQACQGNELRIKNSMASLSGAHLQCINSRGMVRVHNSDISQDDIQDVLAAAQAVPFPEQQQVLHTLPSQYLVDGRSGVRRPQGMAAVRLEVDAQVVTADRNVCRNLGKVLFSGKLKVNRMVSGGLCAAAAVLDRDEVQTGALVLDIGAGKTDIVLIRNGYLQKLYTLSEAGDKVTARIARELRIPMAEAENLKLRHGSAAPDLIASSEQVQIPAIHGSVERTLPRRELAELISSCYYELFQQVRLVVERDQLELNSLAGIVLTGGGAKIESLQSAAEEVLESAVRIGTPKVDGRLGYVVSDPAFATSVGGMLFAVQQPPPMDCFFTHTAPTPRRRSSDSNFLLAVWRWLRENY
ncbi:MAG: cell division protein FtsA [Gammaproteobacteria bacterium]